VRTYTNYEGMIMEKVEAEVAVHSYPDIVVVVVMP
jgi:hypothetical protein